WACGRRRCENPCDALARSRSRPCDSPWRRAGSTGCLESSGISAQSLLEAFLFTGLERRPSSAGACALIGGGERGAGALPAVIRERVPPCVALAMDQPTQAGLLAVPLQGFAQALDLVDCRAEHFVGYEAALAALAIARVPE